ncbi:hypothetical protein LP420_19685 [Massilia sp. B-10]|nr:hypothetical protein LP420_19685 [Massilia sp. B-10]
MDFTEQAAVFLGHQFDAVGLGPAHEAVNIVLGHFVRGAGNAVGHGRHVLVQRQQLGGVGRRCLPDH